MAHLFSPTSSRQHEFEIHNPARCQQLRGREILDKVAVMTSGAFVAAYELSGVHSYYHSEEMRNRAKESFEAVLRSMPDGKLRHRSRVFGQIRFNAIGGFNPQHIEANIGGVFESAGFRAG